MLVGLPTPHAMLVKARPCFTSPTKGPRSRKCSPKARTAQPWARGGRSPRHLRMNRFTTEPSGFAEYWPRELITGRTSDLLVIHLNGQSLDRLTLNSTLCHEIYGHGSFYGEIRACQPSLIDHGDFVLVEGWATWCEWRFSDGAYASWARSRRLVSLSSIDATAEEITTDIDAMISEDRYHLNRDARMIEAFQYPGLAASYAVGGLWLEQRERVAQTTGFLDVLRGRFGQLPPLTALPASHAVG